MEKNKHLYCWSWTLKIMTYTYKKLKDPYTGEDINDMIYRKEDGAWIPFNEQNIDYQAYKEFLENGGVADDADATLSFIPPSS